MRVLLVLCLLCIACGPVRVAQPIPPNAILTAAEEDALADATPDPQVYVLGSVKVGGAFPFHRGMTVLQALALAGGFGEWAKIGSITVARDVGGEWLGYEPFNLKRVMQRKPARDFRLRPGDIVLVP